MKKFKFRLQVVLDMRENELERHQMEMAKILTVLNKQQDELKDILQQQVRNSEEIDTLYSLDSLDIQQIESHRNYGIKLIADEKNQERVIAHTKSLMEIKQKEVSEAYKKVEILKKLKAKQEEEYYKTFLASEVKEIDDITTSRFRLE